MKSDQIVDAMKAALHARADVNNDGKLTRADVAQVARQMAAQVEVQTERHPWPVLLAVTVAASMTGYYFRAFIGC